MIAILAGHIHEFLFVVLCILFVFATLRFFLPRLMPISLRSTALLLISVWASYGILLAIVQYMIWTQDPSTKALLSLPLDSAVVFPWWLAWLRGAFAYSGGAFLFYVWGHFWFAIILALGFAAFVYGIFALLARYYPGRMRSDDLLLVFVMTFLPGWPKGILVVPLALIFGVLLTLWSALRRKVSPPWVLGTAFLFAGASALFLGGQLLSLVHLYTLLKI